MKAISNWNCFVLFVYCIVGRTHSQTQNRTCESRSCYPATGDLLVGRENRLFASSTCGLRGPKEYCIVGFLKNQKKCFTCDSRPAVDRSRNGFEYSHLPKYVVSTSPNRRFSTWWQAENGRETVYMQLNLEAEFHFTHLIMTFKTFRPAAMIVEKSSDYGRTWKAYRYFAYDCDKVFPRIAKGPQQTINQVVCEERYSQIAPSTEGEVVMKILDPQIPVEDPYSVEVQDLLKLTNLRVNFTKLHTLGDDKLSDGSDVVDKYYYAIYEMVVRGSCSCYGHAEECIPVPGAPDDPIMVHGQCNCTHNTKGRNCEMCRDGYNDLPWRPAFGDLINACKKCDCNSHSEKCHFDPAVYKATGNVGGGVCDDCKHNTTGRQCELCKPLFYRDPFKLIGDPKVCLPCDCDPAGSIGGGECETVTDPGKGTVAGRCICKPNVVGKRCDQCKEGHFDLKESNENGCQSCGCDPRGTVGGNRCDSKTGKCTCKRFVTGSTCNQCLPKYWGLGSSPDGCQSCNCDVGGAHNDNCDEITGLCQCLPNIEGRRCNKPRDGFYFATLDQYKYEAEDAVPSGGDFSVVKMERRKNTPRSWSGDGFMKIAEGTKLDFTMVRVPHTGFYDMAIRYNSKGSIGDTYFTVTLSRTDGKALSGGLCKSPAREQTLSILLTSGSNAKVPNSALCLQKDVGYSIKLHYTRSNLLGDQNVQIDSIILIPRVESIKIFNGRQGQNLLAEYERLKCGELYLKASYPRSRVPPKCLEIQFSMSAVMNQGALSCQCDPVGTVSNGSSEVLFCAKAGGQCPCKPHVIGRRCHQCAPGAYGFSSTGCKACNCNPDGSTSNLCNDITGQCSCIRNIKGRMCDQCPPNHFGFPNCQPCQCFNHSYSCNAKTGACINCRDNTAGNNCEKCAAGYYGDATQGTQNDCEKCQCPGGSSGNQFSTTCYLDKNAKPPVVVCDNCETGYVGQQCEKCANGFYGNPLVRGGKCQKCNCNGNIDEFSPGKCDAVSGECFDCLYNTAGFSCEKCKKGYFGNAKNRTCRACVCNMLGTDNTTDGVCDGISGQCTCRPNVGGVSCDRCEPGFWNLASGKGCEPCQCDKKGSLQGQCNQLDGQCQCRVGFGGRQCLDCEDFFYGDPHTVGCRACNCNPAGSKSLQCDRKTGKCKCRTGITGHLCDMCDAGTTGLMPECTACHPCHDGWDVIVSKMEKNLTSFVPSNLNITFNASDIGEYSVGLKELQDKIIETQRLLDNRKMKAEDVNRFRKQLTEYRSKIEKMKVEARKLTDALIATGQADKENQKELDDLNLRTELLMKNTKDLVRNMTEIAEGNIGGAYNSTLRSLKRSREAQKVVDDAKDALNKSAEARQKFKDEVTDKVPSFDTLHKQNLKLIANLSIDLMELERLKNLTNDLLCGTLESECMGCNSSGCSACGMGNCTGVKKLSQTALQKAYEAEAAVRRKEALAKKMLRDAQSLNEEVKKAYKLAVDAHNKSVEARDLGQEASDNITRLIKDIEEFLKVNFTKPDVTIGIAQKTLALNISLTPDEIRMLAKQINETVKNLTDVNAILNATESDMKRVDDLRRRAQRALEYAMQVMNSTDFVRDMLKKIKDAHADVKAALKNATADIDMTAAILDGIRNKTKMLKEGLTAANTSVDALATKANGVEKQFDENLKRAEEASGEMDKALATINKTEETADKISKKLNDFQDAYKKKFVDIDSLRKRAEVLSGNSRKLFLNILAKIKLLEEYQAHYLRHEKRANDLNDELKKLEARILDLLEKIRIITTCHRTCNPTQLNFCSELGSG